MILKKEKINSILFYLYFCLFAISIILSTFSSIYSRFSVEITFVVVLILALNNKTDILKNSKNVLLFLSIIIISLFSLIFTQGGLGSFFNLFNFICGILIFQNMKIGKKQYIFIKYLTLILYTYNLILSFSIWERYLSGSNNGLNPNSVGIFLFLCFVILTTFFKSKKLILFLFIISVIGIYMTECRSALVAIIVYFIFKNFPIINKIIEKKLSIFLKIITIIGIIFPIIYVSLYKNGVDFTIPFLQKNLYTGREYLWNIMLNALQSEQYGYIFGLGTNYVTQIGIINNYHNWYLGTFYAFGAIIFFLYFAYLIYNVNMLKSPNVKFAFLAIFVIGFFENVGLWNTTQIYIFIFFLIANYKKEGNS